MTNVLINQRTSATSNLNMVSADQDTILGNGTAFDPLRLASGAAGGLVTLVVQSDDLETVGQVVVVQNAAPTIPGVACVGRLAGAGSQSTANAIGVVVASPAAEGRKATVQVAGVVELTEVQWEAVTIGGTGLTPGDPYYLSTSPGLLTAVKLTDPGTFDAQVGVALSATRLLLSTLQYEPVFNSGT